MKLRHPLRKGLLSSILGGVLNNFSAADEARQSVFRTQRQDRWHRKPDHCQLNNVGAEGVVLADALWALKEQIIETIESVLGKKAVMDRQAEQPRNEPQA